MDILNWLLKKENKRTFRVVVCFMVFVPLAFAIGIGFQGHEIYEGVYPIFRWVSEWFRGWFETIMFLMFFIGLILLVPAFSRNNDAKKDL